MTEAERQELEALENRMNRALSGDTTADAPAGDDLRRLLDLQGKRVRDEVLQEYSRGDHGIAAAHAAARLREQSK